MSEALSSTIAAVFFDLDDTLIAYPNGFGSVLREVFAEAERQGTPADAYPCFQRAFWNSTCGLWAAMHTGTISGDEVRRLRLLRAAEAVGLDEAAAPDLLREWDRLAAEAPVLREGALELLDGLRGRVFLGLITDGYRTLQRAKLRRLSLEDHFDGIFISEEVGVCKPFAGIFQTALAAADVEAAAAVMVGDNANADIRGALGVGMRAIHLVTGPGPSSPVGALVADDLAEVGRIVENLLPKRG